MWLASRRHADQITDNIKYFLEVNQENMKYTYITRI